MESEASISGKDATLWGEAPIHLVDADSVATGRYPPAGEPAVFFMNLATARSPAVVAAIAGWPHADVVLCDTTPESTDLATLEWAAANPGRAFVVHTEDSAFRMALDARFRPRDAAWRRSERGPGMAPLPSVIATAPAGATAPDDLLDFLLGTAVPRASGAPGPWWHRVANAVADSPPGRHGAGLPATARARLKLLAPLGLARGPRGAAGEFMEPLLEGGGPLPPPPVDWHVPVPPPRPPASDLVAVRAVPGLLQFRSAARGDPDWVELRRTSAATAEAVVASAASPLRATRPEDFEPQLSSLARVDVGCLGRVTADVMLKLMVERGPRPWIQTSLKQLSAASWPDKEPASGEMRLGIRDWWHASRGAPMPPAIRTAFEETVDRLCVSTLLDDWGKWRIFRDANLVARPDPAARRLRWIPCLSTAGALLTIAPGSPVHDIPPAAPGGTTLAVVPASVPGVEGRVAAIATTRAGASAVRRWARRPPGTIPLDLQVRRVVHPLVYEVEMPGERDSTGGGP